MDTPHQHNNIFLGRSTRWWFYLGGVHIIRTHLGGGGGQGFVTCRKIGSCTVLNYETIQIISLLSKGTLPNQIFGGKKTLVTRSFAERRREPSRDCQGQKVHFIFHLLGTDLFTWSQNSHSVFLSEISKLLLSSDFIFEFKFGEIIFFVNFLDFL